MAYHCSFYKILDRLNDPKQIELAYMDEIRSPQIHKIATSTLAIPKGAKLCRKQDSGGRCSVKFTIKNIIVSNVLRLLVIFLEALARGYQVTTSCSTSCTNRTILLLVKFVEGNLTHVKYQRTQG
jgi:hypothetical protein